MDAAVSWLGRSAPKGLETRWATLGPYYAMFPVTFAKDVIERHTRVGDGVLDPFAGRGTSVYCAFASGRFALGAELGPLGWIYGTTKLNPAPIDRVLTRLRDLEVLSGNFISDAERLPRFFHLCFSAPVRRFLLAARSQLRWRSSRIDRTTMAFLLVYLHGKIDHGRPSALSNQMRQTKALAPDYSVNWWQERGLNTPPDIDVVEFMAERVLWRYARGAPNWDDDTLRLGDCRRVLRGRAKRHGGKFQLLLTSPPYRGVTSYYYDQWLRFWLLGDAAHPTRVGAQWKGKFEDKEQFDGLLNDAFRLSRPLLTADATIYVRTDAREATFDATRAALVRQFPDKRMSCVIAPYQRATQTSLFGDHETKPGEVDIVMQP